MLFRLVKAEKTQQLSVFFLLRRKDSGCCQAAVSRPEFCAKDCGQVVRLNSALWTVFPALGRVVRSVADTSDRRPMPRGNELGRIRTF